MRKIYQIARDIEKHYKNPPLIAKPYLLGMQSVSNADDKMMFDTGRSLIEGFLRTSKPWNTKKAQRLKEELNQYL